MSEISSADPVSRAPGQVVASEASFESISKKFSALEASICNARTAKGSDDILNQLFDLNMDTKKESFVKLIMYSPLLDFVLASSQQWDEDHLEETMYRMFWCANILGTIADTEPRRLVDTDSIDELPLLLNRLVSQALPSPGAPIQPWESKRLNALKSAVWAVGSFARHTQELAALMCDRGAPEAILALLQQTGGRDIVDLSIFALSKLAQGVINLEVDLTRSSLVKVVMTTLATRSDDSAVCSTCWIITHAGCSCSAFLLDLAAEERFPQLFLDIFSPSRAYSSRVLFPASHFLNFLCNHYIPIARLLVQNSLLERLEGLLTYSDDMWIQGDAFSCLAALCGYEDLTLKVLDFGILSKVTRLIADDGIDPGHVLYTAFFTLVNAVLSASPENVMRLVMLPSFVQCLEKLFETGSTNTVDAGISMLEQIALTGSQLGAIQSSSYTDHRGDNPDNPIMQEIYGCLTRRVLQNHIGVLNLEEAVSRHCTPLAFAGANY